MFRRPLIGIYTVLFLHGNSTIAIEPSILGEVDELVDVSAGTVPIEGALGD